MRWDSEGTSEQGEWFEDGRLIVYKESVDGIAGFCFLLSLLVLLNSEASYDFGIASTGVLSWFPRYELRAFCVVFRYHIMLPLSPTPDPARYIIDVKTQWNLTLQLLEQAYLLWIFTQKWPKIHSTVITGHSSQHRMSETSSSTSGKLVDHSDTRPCWCRTDIQLFCIMLSQFTISFSIECMEVSCFAIIKIQWNEEL